jgi:hypothetical protein
MKRSKLFSRGFSYGMWTGGLATSACFSIIQDVAGPDVYAGWVLRYSTSGARAWFFDAVLLLLALWLIVASYRESFRVGAAGNDEGGE